MAAYSTALNTAQVAALTDMSQRPDATLAGGAERNHTLRTSYTLLATEATGEFLSLCQLPAGARIIPHLSRLILSASPGTTLTVDIGTDGDVNAFMETTTLSGAATAKLFTAAAEPASSLNIRRMGDSDLGADLTVKMKFTSAGTLTAGTVLSFEIVFTLPA